MRSAILLALVLAAAGCRGGRQEHAYRPATGGSPARGKALVVAFGCGACHTIPGVRGAAGVVGPPLTTFARRSFIAGEAPNTPENLVRWIRDPQSIEPATAMPKLDLTEAQARDVAAYLYTLE